MANNTEEVLAHRNEIDRLIEIYNNPNADLTTKELAARKLNSYGISLDRASESQSFTRENTGPGPRDLRDREDPSSYDRYDSHEAFMRDIVPQMPPDRYTGRTADGGIDTNEIRREISKYPGGGMYNPGQRHFRYPNYGDNQELLNKYFWLVEGERNRPMERSPGQEEEDLKEILDLMDQGLSLEEAFANSSIINRDLVMGNESPLHGGRRTRMPSAPRDATRVNPIPIAAATVFPALKTIPIGGQESRPDTTSYFPPIIPGQSSSGGWEIPINSSASGISSSSQGPSSSSVPSSASQSSSSSRPTQSSSSSNPIISSSSQGPSSTSADQSSSSRKTQPDTLWYESRDMSRTLIPQNLRLSLEPDTLYGQAYEYESGYEDLVDDQGNRIQAMDPVYKYYDLNGNLVDAGDPNINWMDSRNPVDTGEKAPAVNWDGTPRYEKDYSRPIMAADTNWSSQPLDGYDIQKITDGLKGEFNDQTKRYPMSVAEALAPGVLGQDNTRVDIPIRGRENPNSPFPIGAVGQSELYIPKDYEDWNTQRGADDRAYEKINDINFDNFLKNVGNDLDRSKVDPNYILYEEPARINPGDNSSSSSSDDENSSSSTVFPILRDTVPGDEWSNLISTGRTNSSNFSGTKRDTVNITYADNGLPAMRTISPIPVIVPNGRTSQAPDTVKLVINPAYPRSITTAGPYNLSAVRPNGAADVPLQNPGVAMIGNNTTGYLADHYPKIRIDATSYSGQQYTPTETYDDNQEYFIRDHYPERIDTVGSYIESKPRTVNKPIQRDSTLGTKTQGTTRRRNQAELTLLHNTGKDTLRYPVRITRGNPPAADLQRFIDGQATITGGDNIENPMTAAQRLQHWFLMNRGQLTNNAYQFPRSGTLQQLMGVNATTPTPDQNVYEYFAP